MLVFDDEFLLGDHRNCCTLWAREGKLKHVCFSIDTSILSNAPKEPHPDFAELEFCERERAQIEAACRRAFANRPSREIELQPSDFDQVDA
jgi:hypothetical protein